MSNLYLLVWEYEDGDRECEWTHFVSDKDLVSINDSVKEIIMKFMLDNFDEQPEDYTISNFWLNKVDQQDGYKVVLEKIDG
jgi:hypothetical protein